MLHSPIIKNTFICFFLALLVSCSTKKNTFLNRSYHNTTAHFNVYFNGQEALKEVVQTLEKDHKDNYDKVLPIYKIGTNEQAKSIYPAADKAIAKASKTVQKHSMYIGGKERVKWIKYAYLMVGQANFYKYDYMPALEMFQFVFKQYDKSKIRYDALYWLSRTYNERGSFNESQNMIDLVESEFPMVQKKKRWQHYAVASDLLIKQELYGQAIPSVIKTIKAVKNRKTQTRLKFILAQLYERVGDKPNSTKYYNEVLRRNSPFEMEFNTRINRALVYDNQAGNSGDIKKELKKLGRDDKYIEFQDKIFYALGSIEEEEGHKEDAIKYYKKSVAASTSNVNQKGKSFLRLADIAFKDAQYELSAVYFDSTVAFLLPTDDKFVYASMKKELLDELVANIKTIKTEDSLQKIGNMSPNEQEAYIDNLIEKRKADDEAKKEAEALKQQMAAQAGATASTGTATPQPLGGAVWYFYNPTALSFGLADFTKKFGSRKLEDNWRRSNKQANAKAVFEENDADNAKPDSIPAEYTRDYYLQGLPTKPSDFAASNQKITDAYFGLGILYREQLNENQLAAKNLEELLKRFPENKYKLTTYYQLYKIYTDLANTTKADYYKNKVCTEAPNSDYCKIILDPSIGSSLKNDKQKMEAMYEATYNAFLNLNYDSVITMANEVDRLYSGDATQPKFDFLRALSIGRSATVPEFEASLKDVVMRFPKHKVKDEAKAILEFIAKLTGEEEDYKKKNPDIPPPAPTPIPAIQDSTKQGQAPIPNIPPGTPVAAKQDSAKATSAIPSIYTFAPDSGHYCMIVLTNKGNESTKVKSAISDFNATYYSLEEITITSIQVGAFTSVFLAKFDNKAKAMNYYSTLKQKPESIPSHQPADYKLFAISENNFGKLIKTGSLDAYVSFFDEKYNGK